MESPPIAVDQREVKPALSSHNLNPSVKDSSATEHVIFGLQVIRVVGVIMVFISGAISIVTTQFILKLMFFRKFNLIHGILALTKKHFVILLTAIMNTVCPSKIRVTADLNSMPKGSFKLVNGHLLSALNPTSVVIANHQIYTDWAFLWWVAYTAGLGDSVYIMLKNSLKKIPILGYGMKNYRFIFLNRKWEQDAKIMEKSLRQLDYLSTVGSSDNYDPVENKNPSPHPKTLMKWPYCLILFPEGTNMSPSRREVSNKYCARLGRENMRNVLLPRVTGLRHTLKYLRNSCDVVYDVTIGYSDVKKHEYGELIYTMGAVFIKGRSPKITDMYWRAIKLDEIPGLGKHGETLDEEEANTREFQKWLFALWDSKDKLLDTFYENGTFVKDPETLGQYQVVMANLKPQSVFEFLQIFAVPVILLLLARLIFKFFMGFF